MAFVYEEITDDDEKIWNRIGFRDWTKHYMDCFGDWITDRENNIYLIKIGTFRFETPFYCDMYYKKAIVRMEKKNASVGNISTGIIFNTIITKMSIPRSLWEERENIKKAVIEALKVDTRGYKEEYIIDIRASIECEPEMIEVDYNGR